MNAKKVDVLKRRLDKLGFTVLVINDTRTMIVPASKSAGMEPGWLREIKKRFTGP